MRSQNFSFPIWLSCQQGRMVKVKGNAAAPRPVRGQLPTVTAAAPENGRGGRFGTVVCNKEHTDATAHV